ncbi:mfs transporter [Trichoderma arundinaceum]|uniref:Mfs transporter n=1 Tax=Trichoderma arundinaceum TaxID=490622 RepID=A0A395NWI2_TRIAR|nr:mfs transporter [Trichoderma arundinaceum]
MSEKEEFAGVQTDEDVEATKEACTDGVTAHIDAARSRALVRKQDFRIIPITAGIYLLCYLDRSNIGNAKVLNSSTGNDLLTETHMTTYQYTIALMVFLIAYALFEVPSNYFLKKLKPSRWIAFLMFSWGAITMGIAGTQNHASVTVVRFLLGVFEAAYLQGLFPGLVYYLTFWYRVEERSIRVAAILASATLAGAFGGAIAFGVGHMNQAAGISAWRWLFILEGAPSVLSSFLVWFFLPDYPETVAWLSAEEKDFAALRLSDQGSHGGGKSLTWDEAKSTLLEWRLWAHYFIYFGISTPFSSLSLFTPSIVAGLGFTDLKAQLMTVPPYAAAYVVTLLASWSGDHFNKRALHSAAFSLIGAIGFIASATLPADHFASRYGCLIIAACGSFACIPPLLGWLSANLYSTAAIGLAIALNISMGAPGQIVGVWIYKADEAKIGYPTGHWTNAGLLLFVCTTPSSEAPGRRAEYGSDSSNIDCHVQSLERRIQQLEATNRALTSANAAHRTVAHRVAREADARSSPRSSAASDNDVANEVTFLSTSIGGDSLFFGPTSGIILASLVRAGVAVDVERDGPTSSTSSVPVHRSPGRAEWGTGDRSLPGEKLARGLIEAYLAHDHLCYPFLHPRAVRAVVDGIYSDVGFERTHPFEAFMFHMILAIATSQVYKFNWRVLPDAETHLQIATDYLNAVLLEGGLRALQAMLLLCQFRLSNSTNHASDSLWHIVGIAVRMCFELGLHREAMYQTSASRHDATDASSFLSPKYEESEVRRRCFWSVYALDRVVSVTLGRPLAICIEDIDVELPTDDLEETATASTLSPGSDRDSSQIPPRYRTAIFVHIVRYRDICGRCLTALHRGGRNGIQSPTDFYQKRDELATELNVWRAETSRLNTPEMDLSTPLAEARSSFRSKAWYELLYHNGVLLLYRPSASTVSDGRDGSSLQHVFSAARQAIALYAYLFRSRKINFSWMVLHAIFMAGISYIYALSRHFREKRRRRNGGEGEGIRFQLLQEPTIVEIVNDCRACSNVIVGVSERCNAQKNCHEVFDRLSDALVEDAVEALSHIRQPGSMAASQDNHAPMMPAQLPGGDIHMQSNPPEHSLVRTESSNNGYSARDTVLLGEDGVQEENGRQVFSSGTPLAADNALRDCLPELQRMYNMQWGDDGILQLSNDWLGEISGYDRFMGTEWSMEQ